MQRELANNEVKHYYDDFVGGVEKMMIEVWLNKYNH